MQIFKKLQYDTQATFNRSQAHQRPQITDQILCKHSRNMNVFINTGRDEHADVRGASKRSLGGEPLRIVASGCRPGGAVEIRARRLRDAQGIVWTSRAT